MVIKCDKITPLDIITYVYYVSQIRVYLDVYGASLHFRFWGGGS